MLVIIQIAFVLLNVGTAVYQGRLFAKGKGINHAAFAAAYCALIVPVWFWQHNLLLCVALLIQRLPVFNTALNLVRHKPFFYTGTASVMDRLIGKAYPYVLFLSMAALITIQFFL